MSIPMKTELSSGMKTALPVLLTLIKHGHEAVFVGGAVRDLMLGLEDKDVDIATSALPEQTMALFPKCIGTGLQHGTVTVMVEGNGYEVTTYRQESPYEDHRRPGSVQFIGNLEGDLLRRDFTINAMALGADGELHDPFGGLEDLKNRRLRCVGDPDARLQEDALRMLRGVRFIGTYGLSPTLSTWRALRRHRALLRHVAMERVQAELDKMVDGPAPERSLAWLSLSGLLKHTREELNLPEPIDCIDLSWLGELPGKDNRYAALFIACGMDGAAAFSCMSKLRFSGKRMDAVRNRLDMHARYLLVPEEADEDSLWRKTVLEYGREAAAEWLEMALLLPDELAPGIAGKGGGYRHVMESLPVSSARELSVNGAELAEALGKKPGPWTREMLLRLLHAVADGELLNHKEVLISQGMKWTMESNHEPK
ncbi:CCA tRNA nucleotidyltransferase [Paenibacillus oryzae]|nr:CCA tRNA nucleotidyltransferase [Paenibacillus oryzae]